MINWMRKITSKVKPYSHKDSIAMAKYLRNMTFKSPDEAREFVLRKLRISNEQ